LRGPSAILGSIPGLTIGIDARAATEEIASVVRELLRPLAARVEPRRYVLYARKHWHEMLDARFQWALGLRDGPGGTSPPRARPAANRDDLAARGNARAAQFLWGRFAERTLSTPEAVA
jgi:hypothetical protein